MFSLRGIIAVFLTLIVCFFILLTELSCMQKREETLSTKRYTDPKGYFAIYPPEGWQIQEYPDDPRGKVAFIGPKTVSLRILASEKDFSSFEELLALAQENAKDIQRKFGAAVDIQKATFLNRPAIKREIVFRGRKFVAFEFMDGNIRHDLQFDAPENVFNKYLSIATKAMETYEPFLKTGSEENIKKHILANKQRLAQLFVKQGLFDLAIEHIDEGLKIDPKNQELLKLKREVEGRTRK